MSLDFTVLEDLTSNTKTKEKQAPRGFLKPLNDKTNINASLEDKKAVNEQIESFRSYNGLARRIKRKNEEKDKQKQIFLMYTENLSKASIEQAEILKGLKAGNDIYNLFLKAIDTIELLSNNKAFSNQARENVIKVYGEQLGNKRPLEIQLEEINNRYNNIKKSLQQAKGEDKKRIEKAAAEHKQKMDNLVNKINSIEN